MTGPRGLERVADGARMIVNDDAVYPQAAAMKSAWHDLDESTHFMIGNDLLTAPFFERAQLEPHLVVKGAFSKFLKGEPLAASPLSLAQRAPRAPTGARPAKRTRRGSRRAFYDRTFIGTFYDRAAMLTANLYTSVFAVHCDTCGAKRGELGAARDGAETTLRSEGWRDTVPFGKAREAALWACPSCASSRRP